MEYFKYGNLEIEYLKGIMKLYGLEEISKKDFQAYRKKYEPYATVASIYIWEISLGV